MRPPNFETPGAWQELFARAMTLVDHLGTVVNEPLWSFGGGTVLMLRLDHRLSKDIDLFVPDPQYLGYVSPRLSDAAENLTHDYQEGAIFVKLYLAEGEIDFVVGTPLTDQPWDVVEHAGRAVKVETAAEIIAKKMHHRGDQAKARDLFDLGAVAELEPEAIEVARPFMTRHANAFMERLEQMSDLVREDFKKIETVGYRRSFDECMTLAERVLR